MDAEIRLLFKQIDEMNQNAYEFPAQSWEEYQRRIGKFQGIREAIDILVAFQNDDRNN
jgi:hypothetical protein